MNTQRLPDEFKNMTDVEAVEKVRHIKRRLGSDLLILGHHYQSDAVIEIADQRGDSLELARKASKTDARLILFAGVHFMAETADILTGPSQKVILPDAEAGCPMADMASVDEVADAWLQLSEIFDVESELLPVTYVNSSAALKAFCGDHGGTVCTSSNAGQIVAWALQQRRRLLFMPDRHLGGNIVKMAGIGDSETILWRPYQPYGDNELDAVKNAKVILWQGHCPVHDRFAVEQVIQARKSFPDTKVLVHLECSKEVVAATDGAGSTSWLINQIGKASPGDSFTIGTEISLVERLARQNSHLKIRPLLLSRCPNMYKTSVQDIAWVLSKPGEINVISVPEEIRDSAYKALKAMLDLSA
jgi:quinolinate synthase